MKSDLDQLIEQYEAEKSAFEQLLKDCLYLQDYLGAYYYSQTLYRIDSELSLLQFFKDPLYDDKQALEKMLLRSKGEPNYMQAFWEERIENEKNRIQKIIGAQDEFFYDTQEIDDAFFRLYERGIKGFKFCLKMKKENLCFDFELSESHILTISIRITQASNNTNIFDQYIFKGFKRLGFKLNDEGNLLIYQYDMYGFKDAFFLKTLLARIIYEVYGYRSFDSAYLLFNYY